MSAKMSLELKKFEEFNRKFDKGDCGTQRYGQAFHGFFKLDKITDQTVLKNLYAKDGQHARNLVKELFEFN